MPYHIGMADSCPADQPHAVIKDATGEVMGCHMSESDAQEQMAALYAAEGRAAWTGAYINDLPDSAFACVDSGGTKDEDGRTVPRSLRHYPHHDRSGALDLPHLRNALARARQAGTATCGLDHLEAHARAAGVGERSAAAYERAIPFVTEFEFRAVGDAPLPRFYGYAAVFAADSEPMPFIETIQPGSFARSLGSDRDHTFVIDHDETKLLSSRRARTLTLAEDSRGLLVESDLPDTTYARDLVALHERGEARSMSFTFRPTRTGESWSVDGRRRTLTEVRLGHVTVLTGMAPAYRQTSANLRGLARALGSDVDDLADAFDALRDGQPLDTRAVLLLGAAIAELRIEPEAAMVASGSAPLSISIARARLALLARSR